MQQIQITLKPEYRAICPPLSKREYEALKRSIGENGLYEPITTNPEGIILDGHHRYRACRELGIEPDFRELEFPDRLSEKAYVVETNLRRRQLSDLERAELGLELEKIEAERAKRRQILLGKTHGKHPLSSNELKGQARDLAARAVGLSSTTYQRAKTILERGSEELIDRVRQGGVSITYAYKKIRRREKHLKPPKLPEGIYDVVYADPPWDYYLPLRGDPEFHYPTMPTSEICDLEVPASENAVLFLWTTNPKLEDALSVIKAWGFTYKTNLAWVKDKIGTGYYFRARHELLLLATKGNIPPPVETSRPHSVLFSPREGHSEKPDEAYELIEVMYPNRQCLELFARRNREGWTSWGDET